MWEDLVTRFGLWAVFLGSMVEGDLLPILGGVSAHLALLKLPEAMAAAAAGCLAGDLVWYAVGRHRAEAIRDTRLYRRLGPKVEALVDRLGPWQILAARAVYGTRNLTMLLWGVRRLSLARFLLVDLVGCTLWGVSLPGLGYLASGGVAAVVGEVKRVELWLLAAALAAGIGLGVARAAQRAARG